MSRNSQVYVSGTEPDRTLTSVRAAVPGAHPARRRALPWDVLLLTAAALILVSVARLHAFVPGLEAVRPALFLSLVAIPVLLLSQTGARRLDRLRGPLGYAMAFLVFWAAMGSPFGVYPGMSIRFVLEEYFRTGLLAVVIAASVRDVRDLERLLKVHALGAVAFSVLANAGGFKLLGGGGYDANDAAMFIVSALPLVMYFALRAPTLLGKAAYSAGLVACGSAIVVSGSRGGFLALLAVVAFALFGLHGVRRTLRIGVIAGLAAVIALSATGEFWDRIESLTDPDDYNRHSYGGRVEIWKRGVGYMAGNPLFGVGINGFPAAEGRHPLLVQIQEGGQGVKWSAAHSIWVQVGAEVGVPGLIALVLIFWFAVRRLWSPDGPERGGNRTRGDPESALLAELGRPLIGVLLGIAVAGTFLSNAHGGLVWMTFALALAFDKVARMQGTTGRRYAAVPSRRRVRRS
jgi:O-antigen ligase